MLSSLQEFGDPGLRVDKEDLEELVRPDQEMRRNPLNVENEKQRRPFADGFFMVLRNPMEELDEAPIMMNIGWC
jgi:hypothetical protein